MAEIDLDYQGAKKLDLLPFEPQEGVTIREPLAPGPGHWAGAPTAQYDPVTERYCLFYRLRQPRPIRGGDCRIAVSQDGIEFEDVWSATSGDFDSPSIEKCCVFRGLDGRFRLYVSYVDGETGRWRVDLLEADRPEALRPADRKPVLLPDDIDVEGVKDPNVYLYNGVYVMLLSYAPRPGQAADEQTMHGTADVYNTGVTTSETGLAISRDGVRFGWQGNVMRPGRGWDAYCARVSSLVHMPPHWLAFYDGSASVEENYEEQAGLAVTWDLLRFTSLTPFGPWTTSGGGSGSIRYVEALDLGDRVHYYYEYARPDGSHELRLSVVSRTGAE